MVFLLFLAGPAGASDNEWSRSPGPTRGASRAIGGVAHGCIAGAVRLPLDGPGYQVIRTSRRRYFGHPDTVVFVQRLGKRAKAAGLAPFYVGDMAQPRGGPLPFCHASHQSGIDVDIWFNLEPKPRLVAADREDVDLPSMLAADHRSVDPKRFSSRQVSLLRMAASDPHVERIFVNPAIKEALCRGADGAALGDREWLHRIRPWRGHDEHFHVRLVCPANSPECEEQAPIPPGDGCDGSLEAWMGHVSAETPATPVPAIEQVPPRPHLPAACRAVLNGR
jgi:penicillin-insensitive murein DD-endopeptidase